MTRRLVVTGLSLMTDNIWIALYPLIGTLSLPGILTFIGTERVAV